MRALLIIFVAAAAALVTVAWAVLYGGSFFAGGSHYDGFVLWPLVVLATAYAIAIGVIRWALRLR